MHPDEIRADIKARPCEKCGESIPPEGFILTFYRGQFIVLHNECNDFIDSETKGPRIPTRPEGA